MKSISNNKKIYVQVFRILSMLMIILCHFCNENSNSIIVKLGQVFNVGVFCFLFISGYLYSNKKIDDYPRWINNRIKRILIPMYIYLFFVIILTNLYKMNYSYLSYLPYILDIQYFVNEIHFIGHLWFLTIIMICYAFLLLIKKIELKTNIYYLFYPLILLGVVFAFINYNISYMFFYLLTFFIGYMYHNYEKNHSFNLLKISLLFVISFLIRIVFYYYFDSTPIYDTIIYSLAHILLSISIYELIKYVIIRFDIRENCIINHLDNLSFYIYISHYIFIVKPFSLLHLTNNIIINTLLILLLSYFVALLIMYIHKGILKIIESVGDKK